ncbi:hypothetical protein PENSPDRAFT_648588 [Peniophora sp. CONT]|nr:hypothetical protein PENSPDRAFT_648588 [Peniophora sp. CONT]
MYTAEPSLIIWTLHDLLSLHTNGSAENWLVDPNSCRKRRRTYVCMRDVTTHLADSLTGLM